MGLCKCPKKVVSNLFCFDHRVTVCESCLVLNHRKVIAKFLRSKIQLFIFNSSVSVCYKIVSAMAEGFRLRQYLFIVRNES